MEFCLRVNSNRRLCRLKPPARKLRRRQVHRAWRFRFIADQKLLDGRFANSGWLQEIPDSLSKLTWDNAALISKKDADSLGIDNGDMIKITAGQRSLEIAAFILPGQPIGVIGLPLGYGRSRAGRVGDGVGFNTYMLRTSGAMHSVAGVQVTKTGSTFELAATHGTPSY